MLNKSINRPIVFQISQDILGGMSTILWLRAEVYNTYLIFAFPKPWRWYIECLLRAPFPIPSQVMPIDKAHTFGPALHAQKSVFRVIIYYERGAI